MRRAQAPPVTAARPLPRSIPERLYTQRRPPSTSGLGRHPFKVVARVRIPLGASARKPAWLLASCPAAIPAALAAVPHKCPKRWPGVRAPRRAQRRARPAPTHAGGAFAKSSRGRLPAGIAAAFLLTLILRGFESAPDDLAELARPATLFISHPDEYSILVALLTGTAGALSLSTSKSGALVGVLISVTTIPAAANVGVAAAYGDWTEVRGAATQLAVNLTCIVVAVVTTLSLQRIVYRRRRQAAASTSG
jgi:Domain of unknown function (DUF389)